VSYVAVDRQQESREWLETVRACAGYQILDPEDREIGRVHKLLVDANGEPKYVKVKTGPFGLKSALTPVRLVTVDTERRILLLR
jgi:hypothetical protein